MSTPPPILFFNSSILELAGSMFLLLAPCPRRGFPPLIVCFIPALILSVPFCSREFLSLPSGSTRSSESLAPPRNRSPTQVPSLDAASVPNGGPGSAWLASLTRSAPVRSGPLRSDPLRSGPHRSGPVRSGPLAIRLHPLLSGQSTLVRPWPTLQ